MITRNRQGTPYTTIGNIEIALADWPMPTSDAELLRAWQHLETMGFRGYDKQLLVKALLRVHPTMFNHRDTLPRDPVMPDEK